MPAALADHLGLAWNFYFFATLNLAGAVLVYVTVARAAGMEQTGAVASSPFAAWLEPLRNSAAVRRVRHRILHPVRVHRYVHLREFRPGASAAVARPHGAWLRLFRVPAVGGHNALSRAGRSSLRDAAEPVGLARPGGRWLAATSATQSRGGLFGDDLHPRRRLFRPSVRVPASQLRLDRRR